MQPGLYLTLFNEIAIIAQLARARIEARLPDGLTQSHFAVLNHLVRVGEGTTPLALARAFQMPKTSMTHTLAGLEARGLVELRPNPDDGRSRRVWLTPPGRACRDAAIDSLTSDFVAMSANFETETVATIVGLLSELRRHLDANRTV